MSAAANYLTARYLRVAAGWAVSGKGCDQARPSSAWLHPSMMTIVWSDRLVCFNSLSSWEVFAVVERTQGSLYRRIAADLRAKIDAKAYGADGQLPAEPELMAAYDVSRNTVRQALKILSGEGRIVSQPGRGTFVRNRSRLAYTAGVEEPGSESAAAFVAEVTKQDRAAAPGELTMRVLPATAAIAERLRIDLEDLVALRERIRLVDGEPAQIQRSYYPLDIALNTALTKQQEIEQDTITYLSELGHVQIGYRDHVQARMPTPKEIDELRMGEGVPIIDLFRTASSAERPIRLTHTLIPADRFYLLYTVGDISAQLD